MHSNSRLCRLRRPSLPSARPGTGPSAQDPRLSPNLHCGPITPPRALSLLPTQALLPPPPLPTGSHSPTPRTLWVTSSVRQAPCTLAAYLWPQPEPWGEAGLCLLRPPGLHSRNCSAGSGLWYPLLQVSKLKPREPCLRSLIQGGRSQRSTSQPEGPGPPSRNRASKPPARLQCCPVPA